MTRSRARISPVLTTCQLAVSLPAFLAVCTLARTSAAVSTATSAAAATAASTCYSTHQDFRHRRAPARRRGATSSSKRGDTIAAAAAAAAAAASSCWITPQGAGPAMGWLSRARQDRNDEHRSGGGVRDCACSPVASGAATRRSLLSMKARGKKGKAGGAAAVATAGRGGAKQGKKRGALYIQIEDLDSDSWRLAEAGDILRKGGVGVIPTDTCYTFACDILSRKGVERILQIKNEQGRHKPLSLLCKDISTMNTYAKGIDKALFKTMKAVLPGPYTFILPSTNEVPRMLIEHKHHKKTWKRKEIGIRLPDAPVLLDLLQQLDGPLLCSSVPSDFPPDGDWGGTTPITSYDDDDDDNDGDDGEDGEASRGAWSDDALVSGDPAAIEAAWGHAVDFVVDAGVLEVGGFSTVVDAVGAEPVVLREGLGDSSLITG